jgi:hypothetical protein
MGYMTLALLEHRLKAVLAISLACAGCDATNNKSAVTPQPQPTKTVVFQGYQRFVPLSPAPQPRFALDTKTGQICMTWAVVFPSGKDEGYTLDKAIGAGVVVTCLELYNKYPDDTK